MKFSIMMAAGVPMVCAAFAGEKSGHAEASLLCGAASYRPGQPVPVGIRLKIDPGWHSYWVNPGLGGMPLEAAWTLPEGWRAGELRQPVPKRFATGDLPGFGYEGEALFRVDLIPPADAAGEAACSVKLSWLTCDDSACVPGDVELSLKLPAGDGAPNADAATLEEAGKKIPVRSEMPFRVVESESGLDLIFGPGEGLDLTGVSAFPATPEVVDPADPVKIEKTGEGWKATVKKNEYADGPVALLDIVLAGGKLERPLIVSWRAGK